MKIKKRILTVGLVGALFLSACGNGENEKSEDETTTNEIVNYSEAVDYTITGIEPGAGISVTTEKAIEEYENLQGWSVELSSTAAMMAELDKAIENEEPIIITGWNPHWMFAKYPDMKYLEDPKGIYGGKEHIHTMTRKGQPTAGEVIVNGNPLIRFNQKELREVRRAWFGMVFQKFALFPHRSVMGNVEFGLEVQGVPKEERRSRAQKWIEAVGLKGWEDHYPQELSGGMQQRVGLARALAVEPEILLMDEAFSALDPLIRREMQDELLTLQAEMNKTIIFITHDFHEAVKLGDRIAVMRDGEFVQVGTPADIIGSPADEYVAAFADGIGLPPLKDDAG